MVTALSLKRVTYSERNYDYREKQSTVLSNFDTKLKITLSFFSKPTFIDFTSQIKIEKVKPGFCRYKLQEKYI